MQPHEMSSCIQRVTNMFLADSLVSNFMKFGNQECKKLASSFSSGITNYGIGGDRIKHVLWRCVNVN